MPDVQEPSRESETNTKPDGVALPSILAVEIGTKLSDGRYEIVEFLGQGITAQVFLAKDSGPSGENECAIKVYFNPKWDNDFLDRIATAEIAQMLAFDHPHIVRAYDSFEFTTAHKGWRTKALVMEYCHPSLEKWARNGPYGETEALTMLAHGMSGVDYISHIHKVHNDIKPENVLLKNGVAKIADFGASLEIAHTLAVLSGGAGTPDWAAPEPHRSVHSDVYSLTLTVMAAVGGWRRGTSIEDAKNRGLATITDPKIRALIVKALSGTTDKTAALRPLPSKIYKRVTAYLEHDIRVAAKRAQLDEDRRNAEAAEALEREEAEEEARLARIDREMAAAAAAAEEEGRRAANQAKLEHEHELAKWRRTIRLATFRKPHSAYLTTSPDSEPGISDEKRQAWNEALARKKVKDDKTWERKQAAARRQEATARRVATKHPQTGDDLGASRRDRNKRYRDRNYGWTVSLFMAGIGAFFATVFIGATNLGTHTGTWSERSLRVWLGLGVVIPFFGGIILYNILASIRSRPTQWLTTNPGRAIPILIWVAATGFGTGAFILSPFSQVTSFGWSPYKVAAVSPVVVAPTADDDTPSELVADGATRPPPANQVGAAIPDPSMPTAHVENIQIALTQSETAYMVKMGVTFEGGDKPFEMSPAWITSRLGIRSASKPTGATNVYDADTGGPHQLADGTWITPPNPPDSPVMSGGDKFYSNTKGTCWETKMVPAAGFFPAEHTYCTVVFLLPRSIGYTNGDEADSYNGVSATDLNLVLLPSDRDHVVSSVVPRLGLVRPWEN